MNNQFERRTEYPFESRTDIPEKAKEMLRKAFYSIEIGDSVIEDTWGFETTIDIALLNWEFNTPVNIALSNIEKAFPSIMPEIKEILLLRAIECRQSQLVFFMLNSQKFPGYIHKLDSKLFKKALDLFNTSATMVVRPEPEEKTQIITDAGGNQKVLRYIDPEPPQDVYRIFLKETKGAEYTKDAEYTENKKL